MQVEIFELSNTWGCAHREPGTSATIYGGRGLPQNARLWLSEAGGNAVEQIIKAGLGILIKESEGAYGGEKRTVLVDANKLDEACHAVFDKMDALDKQQRKANCHYCGAPVQTANIDFFGAPVCNQCGG